MFTITELAQYCDANYTTPKHIKIMERFLFKTLTKKEQAQCVLNVCVRHGKTEMIIYTMLWLMMTCPDKEIIFVTHTQTFANQQGARVRDLFRQYAPELVGLELSTTKKRADHWGIKDHKATLSSFGIGGKLSSRGAEFIIMDDVVSDQQKAESSLERDNLWRWSSTDLLSRRSPTAKILFIQSVRHIDDIAARFKQVEAEGGAHWEVLRLPALCDNEDDPLGRKIDEPLWPEKFDKKTLLETRENLEASNCGHIWSCLWQNHPRGNPNSLEWTDQIVNESLFYTDLPSEVSAMFKIISVDPSCGKDSKTGDCAAILYIICDNNYNLWVEDAIIKVMNMTEVEDVTIEMMKRHPSNAIIVEANGFQELICVNILGKCKAQNIYCPLHAHTNFLNKEVRIRMSLTPLLMQKKIHINHKVPKALYNQFKGFPILDHDDAIDSFELATQMINKLLGSKKK